MLKKLDINKLIWFGRTLDNKQIRYFNYSSSGFEFCFTGTKATAFFVSDAQNWNEKNLAVLGIFIKEIKKENFLGNSFWEVDDDCFVKKEVLTSQINKITLFESEKVSTVIIKVIKLSEAAFGYAGLENIFIDGKFIKPKKNKNLSFKKIEFIGDSITCGYGIEGICGKDVFDTKQERSDKAFAYLTAKKLNANFQCICWSGIGIISKYVDETIDIPENSITMPLLWPYTDKSLSLRLSLEPEIWDEKKFSPDLVIINLGTNDNSFVRNYENRKKIFINSLRVFLETIHRKIPKAKICCCYGVMGQDLFSSIEDAVNLFKSDFPSTKIKAIKLPNQNEKADGLSTDFHPSQITHQKTAEFLFEQLKTF